MEVGVENSKLLIFLVTNPYPETTQEPTKSPLIRTKDSSSYHLGHYKYSVPGMGGKEMVRQGPWYIFSVISLCISKVSLITQLERIFFSKLSLFYSHCSNDLAVSKTLLYDYAYPCLVKHWVSWKSRSIIWISFVFIWYQIFNEYLLTEHLFIFVCVYIHAFIIPLHFMSSDDVSKVYTCVLKTTTDIFSTLHIENGFSV